MKRITTMLLAYTLLLLVSCSPFTNSQELSKAPKDGAQVTEETSIPAEIPAEIPADNNATAPEGTTMPDPDQMIAAEVLLVAATGEAVTGSTVITAETIDRYRPAAETVQAVSQYFSRNGFEVSPPVGISLTIAAPAETFASFFAVDLPLDEVPSGDRQKAAAAAGNLELPLEAIDDEIASSITAVTFTPPPDFGPTNFGP